MTPELRGQLLARLPENQTFRGLLPYQRKELVEQFISSILDAIEEEGREPDDWESEDIAAAIGLIAGRMYTAALVYGERSLTPENERSPIQPPGEEISIRRLRDALAYVGGMPAPAA